MIEGYKLLGKSDIEALLCAGKLIIKPLLDENQVGEISVDLRVGTDFLTNQLGREGSIDTSNFDYSIKNHYSETRRTLGESFLLHPSQIVLFSTLEYLKLPNDVMAILTTRSSYSRLGVSISTIIQPGYCGCVSVEVNYNGNVPLKILTGARLIQARFYRVGQESDYFSADRKYICQVRPIASKANEDSDLVILKSIKK